VARGCEAQVPRGWLWHQHHVKMVDGTTLARSRRNFYADKRQCHSSLGY